MVFLTQYLNADNSLQINLSEIFLSRNRKPSEVVSQKDFDSQGRQTDRQTDLRLRKVDNTYKNYWTLKKKRIYKSHFLQE